jgi:hypothetical protein
MLQPTSPRHLLHGPHIGTLFVTCKRVLLRVGVEKTSACTEILELGSTITVLQTGQNQSGQLRVRCSQGWVSLKAESGEVLLEPASVVSTAQSVDLAEVTSPAVHDDGTAVAAPVASEDADADETGVGVTKHEQLAPTIAPVATPAPGIPEERRPLNMPVDDTGAAAVAPLGAIGPALAVGPPLIPPVRVAEAAAQAAAATADEVRRLEQQLANAHRELERLKAASSVGSIAPADLARAAVELTARACGDFDNSSGLPLEFRRTGPVAAPMPAAGTWAGGMSPFARARRHQAQVTGAPRGAWTVGSSTGRGRGGPGSPPAGMSRLGSPPAGMSPRPKLAASPPQHSVPRGQSRVTTGTPRSRSAPRHPREPLEASDVLGEARQVSRAAPSDPTCPATHPCNCIVRALTNALSSVHRCVYTGEGRSMDRGMVCSTGNCRP